MKTILVVEDEPSLASLLKMVLEEEGYQVITAGNGRDALTRLSTMPQLKPDLIISDIMMPFMDGRELYHIIKADPKYQKIPFILASAIIDFVDKSQFKDAILLTKPFDINEVIDTVAKLIPPETSATHLD